MMDLYFFRHGIATERSESVHDAERSLTLKGEQRTRQVAKRLKNLGVSFEAILTSPYLRAQQTADILTAVGLGDRPQLFPPLAPDGSFTKAKQWLQEWQPKQTNPSLVFVGHQPDLGAWAEELIWGEPAEHLQLKKAGVIGIHLASLTNSHPENQLFLLTSPKWLL
jgi:phosphohistidine phosphatase